MARSKHYCATCDTHFRADPATHIEIEHDGGIAQIEEDGDFRDWQRKQRFRSKDFSVSDGNGDT